MREISAALARVPICRIGSRDQVIAESVTKAARAASGSKFTLARAPRAVAGSDLVRENTPSSNGGRFLILESLEA